MSQSNNSQGPAGATPWEGDYFGRKADADYLTQFLVNGFRDKRYRNESFVLNLNAKWGYGKSFFLKNWAVDLRQAGHLVVSFDAWKNDYSEDALLSFISEISNDLHDQIKDFNSPSAAEEMIEKALNIVVAVPTVAARIAAALLPDDKKDAIAALDPADFEKTIDIGDFLADRNRLLKLLASNALKENNEKRNAVKEFITSAEKFVSLVSTVRGEQSLPVFFFIDELDRCRPDFSIKLLESIKHIFPVKGFCFVVATDTEQLCQSIKSIYGHDFDSAVYLKRFFDMEYSFSDAGLSNIATALFSSTDISMYLFVPSDIFSNKTAASVFSDICFCFNLGPRSVQHVFDILYACCTANAPRLQHLVFLLPLICIKYLYPAIFSRLSPSSSPSDFEKIAADIGCEGRLKELQYKAYSHGADEYYPGVSLFDVIKNYFYFLRVSGGIDQVNDLSNIEGFRQVYSDLFRGSVHKKDGCYYTDMVNYFDRVKMAGNFSIK